MTDHPRSPTVSTCAACEHPLPCTSCPATHAVPDEAGVSDDFCDSVCQRAWHAAQNTDGYRPTRADAARVYGGDHADQTPQTLADEPAPRVVQHGEPLEDLATQTVDMVAGSLPASWSAELWRGEERGIRVEVVCGHDGCTERVRYAATEPRSHEDAVAYARAVLGQVRDHVTLAHGAALQATDLERIPIWRVVGRWSEQGPVGHQLRTMWTMHARGVPNRDAILVDAACDACARRGDTSEVTVTISGAELAYWLSSSGTRQAYLETVAYYLLGRITAHHDGHPRAHRARDEPTGPRLDTAVLDHASDATAWAISNWAAARVATAPSAAHIIARAVAGGVIT